MCGKWALPITVVFSVAFLAPAVAEIYDRQAKVVEWLNSELAKGEYLSVIKNPHCEEKLVDQKQETVCSYNYADGAVLAIAADEEGLIGTQQMVRYVKSGQHDIERDSMYIFSLLMWGTMGAEMTYRDSSQILTKLYEKSFNQPIAQFATGDWSFAISDTSFCSTPLLVFVSQRLRTGYNASDVLTDPAMGKYNKLCFLFSERK